MTHMALELLTIDMFSDKVGQAFVVREPNVPAIELTLTEVTALQNYANTARAPFSLLFRSKGSAVLPQRIYTLQHADLGPQAFFLVPIAGTKEMVTYQAVFN
jgi:hypothetical protein